MDEGYRFQTNSTCVVWSGIMDSSSRTGIEVNVIDWNNGSREVAIHFKDLNQMVTLNAESARNLSFVLMECADFLEPPFTEEAANPESVSLFGPYEPESDENSGESDEDEQC